MRLVAVVWLVVAILAGIFATWWVGLLIALPLPFLVPILQIFALTRVQMTLQDEYQYSLDNEYARVVQMDTLKRMVRQNLITSANLTHADIATLFMAVQINTLAQGGIPDAQARAQMIHFATRVQQNAARLKSQGKISTDEPMEWIETALAAVIVRTGSSKNTEFQIEPESDAASRVAKQIASEQASKARLRAEQEAKPQTVPAARKPDIGDVLSALSILWLRNPYRCKSEGLRRVTIAASLVALVYWFASVAIQIASKGFSKFDIGDWSIVFGAPIAVYAAIMTVRFLVLWVIDGFRNDRKTK